MDSNDKTILVIGATGNQGGATARHLLENGWKVRGLTRDLQKPAAQALAQAGVEMVQGDIADRASLDRALDGVYGVFSVQNFWVEGYDGEVTQGKAIADAAKAAGVEHFVYTSVGGAERNTGISHFDSKWEIEQHIASLGLPATILRPVFFNENFQSMFKLTESDEGLSFSMPLPPETPLQVIAVDDVGALAAIAFEKPEEYIGKGVEIAGDEITMPQAAESLSEVIGKPVHFVEQPIEQMRSYSEEAAVMFDWFRESGYKADIDSLKEVHPTLSNFKEWAKHTDWN